MSWTVWKKLVSLCIWCTCTAIFLLIIVTCDVRSCVNARFCTALLTPSFPLQKKFEGTRVTVETFLVWKTKFDAELFALRSEKEREEEKNKKLTGRELFQTDNTLIESDLTFLGDGKLLYSCSRYVMVPAQYHKQLSTWYS